MAPSSAELNARARELWIRTLLLVLAPATAVTSLAIGLFEHHLISVGTPGAGSCTALACLIRAIPAPANSNMSAAAQEVAGVH
jgi:hypothetical protein